MQVYTTTMKHLYHTQIGDHLCDGPATSASALASGAA